MRGRATGAGSGGLGMRDAVGQGVVVAGRVVVTGRFGRRSLGLLGVVALAACAGDDPPPRPLDPIGYAFLTPLPLNVGTVEIAPTNPPPVPGDLGPRLVPSAAEAVRIMGRDRLVAVGTAGQAVFSATRAAITSGGGGLTCVVACRIEIIDAAGAQAGFVTAEARASVSGAEASRPQAAERVLRRAMERLNVEFEFQLRRNLRPWLAILPPGAPGGGGGAGGGSPDAVTREDLPRS